MENCPNIYIIYKFKGYYKSATFNQWSSLCHLIYIEHCLFGFLLVHWSILKQEIGDLTDFTAMQLKEIILSESWSFFLFIFLQSKT